jgi:hypothetical protein
MKSATSAASASEVDVYRQCPRKWAFKYRCENPPQAGRRGYFEVGRKFDQLVENYWKFGIIPTGPDPLNDLFMKLIPVIPGPGLHQHLQLRDTWAYKGLPFLTIPDYVGSSRFLGDLKTTKDIRAYGLLTKEQKLENTQTVLYAFRYLLEGGTFDHWYAQKHRAIEIQYEGKTLDPDEIELHRVSKGAQGKPKATGPVEPKALGTPIEFTRGEIVTAFETHVLPASEKVYQLRGKHASIDPMSFPEAQETENPYDRACAQYGGCEYKDTCFPRAKDFSAANLHRGSTEVTLVFGGDAVKFKIQKPEQISIETTAEEAVAKPAPTGRFAPKPKAVTVPYRAAELRPDLAHRADEEVSRVVVERSHAADKDTLTEGQVSVVTTECDYTGEYISPMSVVETEEPTIPVSQLQISVGDVKLTGFVETHGETVIFDEPTIPVDQLVRNETGPRTLTFKGVDYPVKSHAEQVSEAREARALKIGRAILDLFENLK